MAKFYTSTPPRRKDVPDIVRRVLATLPDDFHVCLEFPAIRDFDVVVLQRNGIHVIEVKNERNKVKGGPLTAKWTVYGGDGSAMQPQRDNFYNQAKSCADELKELLRRHTRSILASTCSKPYCAEKFTCNTHRNFWSRCQIFPYVCIPHWNPSNEIEPDNTRWCHLTQTVMPGGSPTFLSSAIFDRGWHHRAATKCLSLSNGEIANIVSFLGLSEISADEAVGKPVGWQPRIDDRTDASLRAAELSELRLMDVPVVAVVGSPKIGKSTLSQLYARELWNRGARFLYHDFRLDHPSLMLERFLRQLSLPAQVGLQDSVQLFCAALANDQVCILLDNLEQIIDPATFAIMDTTLSTFLETFMGTGKSGKSKIILTSRCPILTGTGVSVPVLNLSGVGKEAAKQHLRRCYGWEDLQAEEIYSVKLGHPHAMHICSSKILDQMQLGITFHEALENTRPEVLNLTYGEIYAKLDPFEKLLCELLSVHLLGFDIITIQRLASLLDQHANAVDTVLRLHKLGAVSISNKKWVQLLPEDREFVYRLARNPARLHRVVVQHFKSRLQEAQSRKATESAMEHARAMFHHALCAKDVHEAWNALVGSGLVSNLLSTKSFETLKTLARLLRSVQGSDALSSGQRAAICLYEGSAQAGLGELESSEALLTQAEQLFFAAKHTMGQAESLAQLGFVTRKRGGLGRREREYYEMALNLLSNSVNTEAMHLKSTILGRLGKAAEFEGETPEIIMKYLRQSLELARQLSDSELVASRLAMLGSAVRDLTRDFPTAEKIMLEALGIAQEIKNSGIAVSILSGLGRTYEKWGDRIRARNLYEQALSQTSPADVFGMLDRLGAIAHVCAQFREYERSEHYYKEAVDLARRIHNAKAESENLDGLGSIYRMRGHIAPTTNEKVLYLDRALVCHVRAVEIQEQIGGDLAGLANRYQELGRTYAAIGKLTQAQGLLAKAYMAAKKAHRKHLQAWQLRRLAELFERLGHKVETALLYKQASRLFGSGSSREMRATLRMLKTTVAEMTQEEQVRTLSHAKHLETFVEDIACRIALGRGFAA